MDPVARLGLSCQRDPEGPCHLEVLSALADLEILAVPQKVLVVQLVP